MRQLKIAVAAAMALGLCWAAVPVTASAALNLPEILPFKENQKLTFTAGESRIEEINSQKASSTKAKGEFVVGKTSSSGTATITFEGFEVQLPKEKCISLGGEIPGNVTIKLDWRLVFDTKPEAEGKNLGAGILFTILPETGVHLECQGKAKILYLLKGQFLGLLKPTNKKQKITMLTLEQAAGDNAEKTYWMLNAAKVFEEVKIKEGEMLLGLGSLANKYELAGVAIENGELTTAVEEEIEIMA